MEFVHVVDPEEAVDREEAELPQGLSDPCLALPNQVGECAAGRCDDRLVQHPALGDGPAVLNLRQIGRQLLDKPGQQQVRAHTTHGDGDADVVTQLRERCLYCGEASLVGWQGGCKGRAERERGCVGQRLWCCLLLEHAHVTTPRATNVQRNLPPHIAGQSQGQHRHMRVAA